jgi:hypothetical protein
MPPGLEGRRRLYRADYSDRHMSTRDFPDTGANRQEPPIRPRREVL